MDTKPSWSFSQNFIGRLSEVTLWGQHRCKSLSHFWSCAVEQLFSNPLPESFLFPKKAVSHGLRESVPLPVKLFLNLNLCGVHLDHLASTTGVLFRVCSDTILHSTTVTCFLHSLSWKKSLSNSQLFFLQSLEFLFYVGFSYSHQLW